jgi:peptidylprolyl isomerase
MQPTGVPSITISTTEPFATELGVADLSEGSGTEVQPGMTVTANYCGVGLGTQAVFDSSWARGEPASFPLDGVIAGWQEGLLGMKVGGQRLLVIPSDLGYGDAGTPDGSIPPGETLIFVVELVDAQ